MPRLLLSALPLLLLCACGSPSRNSSPDVVQVTGSYSRSNSVYLRVMGGTPDAVLLGEPDQWSEVVALLDFRQELQVVGRSCGRYEHVRTVGMGSDLEGWVWGPVVSRRKPIPVGDDETYWQDRDKVPGEGGTKTDELSFFAGSPGRSRYNSRTAQSPRIGTKVVDDFEASLNIARPTDSRELHQRFRAFAEAGGLIPD